MLFVKFEFVICNKSLLRKNNENKYNRIQQVKFENSNALSKVLWARSSMLGSFYH